MSKCCECGCGAKVRNRFVSGHNILGDNNPAFRSEVNRKKSKSQKKALADRRKKYPKAHKRWKKHLRKAMKKRFNTPGMREWYSEMMAAKWNKPEFVEAYYKSCPQRHASLKKAWSKCSPEEKAKWVSNAAKGATKHPNSQEYKLYKLLKKHFPGKFEMNVVECKVVAGKLPDFICTKGPLVIEL